MFKFLKMNEHPKTALLLKNRHNTMTDYNASPVILQKKKKKNTRKQHN